MTSLPWGLLGGPNMPKKKKEKKKGPNFKKLKKNLYRDYGTMSGPVWPYTSNRKNVFDLKKSTAGKDNLNAWLHV